MSSISISKSATEKILNDRDIHSQLGRPVVPYLLHYQRSYSTLNDGRIIEHGSGLALSFIDHYDPSDDQYLYIDLGSNCTVVVGPSTFFQAGAHYIDWVDRKFKLTSVARKQCTDIYVDDPNKLPGIGSDMPGRIRRCIRECMERTGCYDF